MGHIKVTIKGSPGAFCASVSDKKHHVNQKANVTWNVDEPKDFPEDGVVYVQFTGDGPFIDGAKNHGHQSGTKGGPFGHFVSGTVTGTALGPYTYALGYTDKTGDHPLVDPEIVVDGNRDNDVAGGGRATVRRTSATKSAKPKRSGAKSAKKAKKPLKAKKGKKAGKPTAVKAAAKRAKPKAKKR
jgi:hypothetical protein